MNTMADTVISKFNKVLFIGTYDNDNRVILKRNENVVLIPNKAFKFDNIVFYTSKLDYKYPFNFNTFSFGKGKAGGLRFSSTSNKTYYLNIKIEGHQGQELWHNGDLIWSRKNSEFTDKFPGSGLISNDKVIRVSYHNSDKIICTELLTDKKVWEWDVINTISKASKIPTGKGPLKGFGEYFFVEYHPHWIKRYMDDVAYCEIVVLNRDTGKELSTFEPCPYFFELTEKHHLSHNGKGLLRYNDWKSGEVLKEIDVSHIQKDLRMDSFQLTHIEDGRAYFCDGRKFNFAVVDISKRELIEHQIVELPYDSPLQIDNVLEHNGKVYVELWFGTFIKRNYVTLVYKPEYLS